MKKVEDLAFWDVFLPDQQNEIVSKAKPSCLSIKWKTISKMIGKLGQGKKM